MEQIDLSPEALTSIKALALKATPSLWLQNGEVAICPPHGYRQDFSEVVNEGDGIYEHTIAYCHEEADAAYISTVHPAVALAMCELIEWQRAEIERLQKIIIRM